MSIETVSVSEAPANPAKPAASLAPAANANPWIYKPWIDLLVGCGAWSAPLLAIAAWLNPSHTHAWAVGFYFLAILFNYPHFMATVYRAYGTREDFQKYKIFTLHVTLLLVLTGVLAHISYRLLPWVFTLYICWSPWHYSGQNYGLLMMFVRRNGASVTPRERRWLYSAFIVSYLILLASFETGPSTDPLVLSLGIPARITFALRTALGLAFAFCSWMAFAPLLRRAGFRAMRAPLVLLSTQFLWFVLPTLLELRAAYQIPQTRYSSGILAVLHSAQYIWITSYYQRREARAAGKSAWHMAGYFIALVAGGIALFIPGPWLVSYLFRFDFTTSFLIFTALVNIHHFILDGAIWKLRDSRVASLLIGQPKAQAAAGAAANMAKPAKTVAAAKPSLWSRPAIRFVAVALLFLWGGVDQLHFALGTSEGNLKALSRAASMNPYDSMVNERIAAAQDSSGDSAAALDSLSRAVAANPQNAALQQSYLRAMIQAGKFDEAYAHYREVLALFPHDADALVNYGMLAARLNHPDEAVDAWQKALAANPNETAAHLYLAEAFDQKSQPAEAVPHWFAFLQSASQTPIPGVGPREEITGLMQLSDDEAGLHEAKAAIKGYESAESLAGRIKDARLQSLALSHLAEVQEEAGNLAGAAAAYQQALALDPKTGDAQSEAADWFNYGQLLRRTTASPALAYACFLHAEILLSGASVTGPALDATRTARTEMEKALGAPAAKSASQNSPALLAQALSLPAAAVGIRSN